MAFISLKEFLGRMELATAEQFDEWNKAWRVAIESGSQESLLAFICRERGLAEDTFLQQLARALNWPFLDLPKLTVPAEARNRISTKVAFQHSVLPTQVLDGTVQVAVSNPFDTAMLNAVRFDARAPVQFALATKVEIEKALKKYYGEGAETLDELAEDEPLELLVGEDKEITETDQEASVIKFVNQVIWEAYKDRATDIHFEPREARFLPAGRESHPGDHHQAARDFPGQRPDWFLQIHFALCVSDHDQLGAQAHHHDRGTGRIRTQRHQPNRRASGDRADVR